MQESNYILVGRSCAIARVKLYSCGQAIYIAIWRTGQVQLKEPNDILADRSYAIVRAKYIEADRSYALQYSNYIPICNARVKLYTGGQVICNCKSQIIFWWAGHMHCNMADRSNATARAKLYSCRRSYTIARVKLYSGGQVICNCKRQIILANRSYAIARVKLYFWQSGHVLVYCQITFWQRRSRVRLYNCRQAIYNCKR